MAHYLRSRDVVVVVTGASAGLGRAIATMLGARGARRTERSTGARAGAVASSGCDAIVEHSG